jgi:hypothetical protein
MDMGKAMLILVLGFAVSAGVIQRNIHQQAQNIVDAYAADYERTAARNAANSAANVVIRELSQSNPISDYSMLALSDTRFAGMADFVSLDTTQVGRLIQLNSTAWFLGSEDKQRLSGGNFRTTELQSLLEGGDSIEHETRVLLRRRNVMPPVPSAVFINAPATFDFEGNAFLVDGNDTNLDGSGGDCDELPGIGVIDGGSQSNALAALAPQQRNNVQGQGGFPSVSVLTDPPDLEEIVDILSRNADRTYTGYTSVSGGTASTWGSLANPQITVIDGDLHITGGGQAAGVLVVKGDLTFPGTFRWDGVVIVMGENVSIRGTPDIYGSLMIQADNVFYEMAGNPGVRYSCEALLNNEGLMALGLAMIVSWWE